MRKTMKMTMLKPALFGLLVTLSSIANAGLITIKNQSFEESNNLNIVHNGRHYNHSVLHWVGNRFGTMSTEDFTGTNIDGEKNVWSNGGTLEQTLDETLMVGTYNLSAWFGDRADTAYPGAMAQLWAGSSLIGSIDVDSLPDGQWQQFAANFDIDSNHLALGDTLRVKLVSNGIQTLFDDVQLTYIPEPTALTITCFALMALVSRKRLRH
ncbi:hypothetical protein AADZ84_16785 [Colwelliaceae bacterium MEBiC 14330]